MGVGREKGYARAAWPRAARPRARRDGGRGGGGAGGKRSGAAPRTHTVDGVVERHAVVVVVALKGKLPQHAALGLLDKLAHVLHLRAVQAQGLRHAARHVLCENLDEKWFTAIPVTSFGSGF